MKFEGFFAKQGKIARSGLSARPIGRTRAARDVARSRAEFRVKFRLLKILGYFEHPKSVLISSEPTGSMLCSNHDATYGIVFLT